MSNLEVGVLDVLDSGLKFLLVSPQLVPEVSPRWPQVYSFECELDSFVECVFGLGHQFHMDPHLCEIAWGSTYISFIWERSRQWPVLSQKMVCCHLSNSRRLVSSVVMSRCCFQFGWKLFLTRVLASMSKSSIWCGNCLSLLPALNLESLSASSFPSISQWWDSLECDSALLGEVEEICV